MTRWCSKAPARCASRGRGITFGAGSSEALDSSDISTCGAKRRGTGWSNRMGWYGEGASTHLGDADTFSLHLPCVGPRPRASLWSIKALPETPCGSAGTLSIAQRW